MIKICTQRSWIEITRACNCDQQFVLQLKHCVGRQSSVWLRNFGWKGNNNCTIFSKHSVFHVNLLFWRVIFFSLKLFLFCFGKYQHLSSALSRFYFFFFICPFVWYFFFSFFSLLFVTFFLFLFLVLWLTGFVRIELVFYHRRNTQHGVHLMCSISFIETPCQKVQKVPIVCSWISFIIYL